MAKLFCANLLLTVLFISPHLGRKIRLEDNLLNYDHFDVYRIEEDNEIDTRASANEGIPTVKVNSENNKEFTVLILDYPQGPEIVMKQIEGKPKQPPPKYFTFATPFMPKVLAKLKLHGALINKEQTEFLKGLADRSDPIAFFDFSNEMASRNPKAFDNKKFTDFATTGFFETGPPTLSLNNVKRWIPRMKNSLLVATKVKTETQVDGVGLDELEEKEKRTPDVFVDLYATGIRQYSVSLLEQLFAQAKEELELQEKDQTSDDFNLDTAVATINQELKANFFDKLVSELTKNQEKFEMIQKNIQENEEFNAYFTRTRHEFEGNVNSDFTLPLVLFTFTRYKVNQNLGYFNKSVLKDPLKLFFNFNNRLRGHAIQGSKSRFMNEFVLLTWKCLILIFTPISFDWVHTFNMAFYNQALGQVQSEYLAKVSETYFDAESDEWKAKVAEVLGPFRNFLFISEYLTPRMFTYIHNFIQKVVTPMVDSIYSNQDFLQSLGKEVSGQGYVFSSVGLNKQLFSFASDVEAHPKFAFIPGFIPLKFVDDRLLI